MEDIIKLMQNCRRLDCGILKVMLIFAKSHEIFKVLLVTRILWVSKRDFSNTRPLNQNLLRSLYIRSFLIYTTECIPEASRRRNTFLNILRYDWLLLQQLYFDWLK